MTQEPHYKIQVKVRQKTVYVCAGRDFDTYRQARKHQIALDLEDSLRSSPTRDWAEKIRFAFNCVDAIHPEPVTQATSPTEKAFTAEVSRFLRATKPPEPFVPMPEISKTPLMDTLRLNRRNIPPSVWSKLDVFGLYSLEDFYTEVRRRYDAGSKFSGYMLIVALSKQIHLDMSHMALLEEICSSQPAPIATEKEVQ